MKFFLILLSVLLNCFTTSSAAYGTDCSMQFATGSEDELKGAYFRLKSCTRADLVNFVSSTNQDSFRAELVAVIRQIKGIDDLDPRAVACVEDQCKLPIPDQFVHIVMNNREDEGQWRNLNNCPSHLDSSGKCIVPPVGPSDDEQATDESNSQLDQKMLEIFGVKNFPEVDVPEFVAFRKQTTEASAFPFSSTSVMRAKQLVGLVKFVGKLVQKENLNTSQGQSVRFAYDVFVSGRNRQDEVLLRSLARRRAAFEAGFNRLSDLLERAIQQNNKRGLGLEVQYKLSMDSTIKSVQSGLELTAFLQEKLQSLLKRSLEQDATISQIAPPSQVLLEATEEAIDRLRSKAMTAVQMKAVDALIAKQISGADAEAIARKISQYLGKKANASNELAKSQWQSILSSHLDHNGLIKSWSSLVSLPRDYKLRTSEVSPAGRAVRQTINAALGFLVRSNATSEQPMFKEAIRYASIADYSLSQDDKQRGDRFLNRARALLDFASNNRRVNRYKRLLISPGAKAMFGELAAVNDYQTYESTRVANRAAGQSLEKLDTAQLYTLVTSIKSLAQVSLRSNIEHFHSVLDRAHRIVDFAQGLAMGVQEGAGGAIDSIAGLAKFVTSPVDSVKALGLAVYQWEDTLGVAIDSVQDFIQSVPEMDAEAWGRLTGKIAFDISTSMIGLAFVKPAQVASTTAQLATNPAVKTVSRKLANRMVNTKPAIDAMGRDKFKELIRSDGKSRPDPKTYLPKEYIDKHLAPFKEGAARFIKKSDIPNNYLYREDGRVFVLPKKVADQLEESYANDFSGLARALGKNPTDFDNDDLVRIDFHKPEKIELSIPSGREMSANEDWMPGGILPDGSLEATVNFKQAKLKEDWDYKVIEK